MATSTFSIRLDSEDRMRFEKLAKDTGVSMSAAFNMFVKASLKNNRLTMPVDVSAPSIPAWVLNELAERRELAKDSNTGWYSTEEVKKELGLL